MLHSLKLFLLLERCCNNFIDLLQRRSRENEPRYLRFIIQKSGDLVFIPSLRAHAVLAIDNGNATIRIECFIRMGCFHCRGFYNVDNPI